MRPIYLKRKDCGLFPENTMQTTSHSKSEQIELLVP